MQNFTVRQTATRDSGIELLKIMAIILIVISHVVKTMWVPSSYISDKEYIFNLSFATTNIWHFILILFNCFGILGNSIFFVCSAWFLLYSSKCNKKKWFYMLVEIWVISIIILVVTYIIRHGDISGKIIIESILPTTFGNNWYLTCYLLFYPIHPLLNVIINYMNKQLLFRVSLIMFILYCCFNFIKGSLFFSSFFVMVSI